MDDVTISLQKVISAGASYLRRLGMMSFRQLQAAWGFKTDAAIRRATH